MPGHLRTLRASCRRRIAETRQALAAEPAASPEAALLHVQLGFLQRLHAAAGRPE